MNEQYANNRVSKVLGIDLPIIQAPMLWLTDATLVSSVSNAGGLGVLGPSAGQTGPSHSKEESRQRVATEIAKTKALTNKPFGINILTPAGGGRNASTDRTLEEAIMAHVAVYVVVGDPNEWYFDQIHEAGGTIVYRPLNPSVEVAKEGEALGADVLVATGFDEGGVLPHSSWGTFTVVPTLVDAVNIPVMAAGGIVDRRGVKAAFDLEAEGVYLGTRFLMTRESPMDQSAKQLVIDSGYKDLRFVVPDQRSIATATANQLADALEKNPVADHYPAFRKSGGNLVGMRLGNTDGGTVSTDTAIDLVHDVPSVQELVNRLMFD